MTVAAMQRAPSEDQLYDLAEVFKVAIRRGYASFTACFRGSTV